MRKHYQDTAAQAEISKKEYEQTLEKERELEREIAAIREEYGKYLDNVIFKLD